MCSVRTALALLRVAALSLVLGPALAYAERPFDTPGPGSRERRAILDAVRPAVERAYREKVKFSVRELQSNGDLALVFVVPLDSHGVYLGARTLQDARGHVLQLDGWVFAIVQRDGKRWRVLELDLTQELDGLETWPAAYPAIPADVFEVVGLATNADG